MVMIIRFKILPYLIFTYQRDWVREQEEEEEEEKDAIVIIVAAMQGAVFWPNTLLCDKFPLHHAKLFHLCQEGPKDIRLITVN